MRFGIGVSFGGVLFDLCCCIIIVAAVCARKCRRNPTAMMTGQRRRDVRPAAHAAASKPIPTPATSSGTFTPHSARPPSRQMPVRRSCSAHSASYCMPLAAVYVLAASDAASAALQSMDGCKALSVLSRGTSEPDRRRRQRSASVTDSEEVFPAGAFPKGADDT